MNQLLNLTHLKFFCDAVLYNSISESAKTNFVTQSTVSQAIAKLEVVLGTSLTVHSRQKFQLTEEGQILFDQARHVFKSVQDIHDKICLNKESVTGTVKFVSINSLGMSFLPHSFNKMQTNFPQINLSFRLGGPNFIRNALRQGDAEFAIVVFNPEYEQFSKHPLKKGQFHLYQSVDASHHLIEKGILIDYMDGMFVNDLRESLMQSVQSKNVMFTEVAAWEVVARFAERCIGVGFFPDYIMENNRYPSLKPYPLDIPFFDYQICAIYNKGAKLSRAAQTFLDQFSLE